MGEQFFSGIENVWHKLGKRIVILIIGWLIISTILIKILFAYFMYYVHKENAKVFYEINSSTSKIEDTEYAEYEVSVQEVKKYIVTDRQIT